MTLRLRAHREIVEEYLALSVVPQHHPFGSASPTIPVPVDQEEGPHQTSYLTPTPPPPFDVLRSANTLAMLIRVFKEQRLREEAARKLFTSDANAIGGGDKGSSGGCGGGGGRYYSPMSPPRQGQGILSPRAATNNNNNNTIHVVCNTAVAAEGNDDVGIIKGPTAEGWDSCDSLSLLSPNPQTDGSVARNGTSAACALVEMYSPLRPSQTFSSSSVGNGDDGKKGAEEEDEGLLAAPPLPMSFDNHNGTDLEESAMRRGGRGIAPSSSAVVYSWVDDDEMFLCTEALRRFQLVVDGATKGKRGTEVGQNKTTTNTKRGGAFYSSRVVTGEGPLLPPALAEALRNQHEGEEEDEGGNAFLSGIEEEGQPKSVRIDHHTTNTFNTHGDTSTKNATGKEEEEAADATFSSSTINVQIIRKVPKVTWQKRPARGLDDPSLASRALNGVEPAMALAIASAVATVVSEEEGSSGTHPKGEEASQQHKGKGPSTTRNGGGEVEGTVGVGGGGAVQEGAQRGKHQQQQEAVLSDIQKMVAEMRNNAFNMRDTLQAEMRVIGETEHLLQNTAAKAVSQTKKVDALSGSSPSLSGQDGSSGGVIESLLRKVLPRPVVSMMMNSLAAVVALIKTVLWVLFILSIAAATVFIILMRKKATEVTIIEEIG